MMTYELELLELGVASEDTHGDPGDFEEVGDRLPN
jgi:hypothetical protein